jgi:hypothetical protein
VSCRVVSCRVVSWSVVSCRVVSCRVVSCRVVSWSVVECRGVSWSGVVGQGTHREVFAYGDDGLVEGWNVCQHARMAAAMVTSHHAALALAQPSLLCCWSLSYQGQGQDLAAP